MEGKFKDKEWTQQQKLNFGGANRNAINAMKEELISIDQTLRSDIDPRALTDWERHSRETLLSAVGTMASFDIKKLSNPAYTETIEQSISLLREGTEIHERVDHFQQTFKELVSENPTISKGLAAVETAIFRKNQAAFWGTKSLFRISLWHSENGAGAVRSRFRFLSDYFPLAHMVSGTHNSFLLHAVNQASSTVIAKF